MKHPQIGSQPGIIHSGELPVHNRFGLHIPGFTSAHAKVLAALCGALPNLQWCMTVGPANDDRMQRGSMLCTRKAPQQPRALKP
jgi:hypothetical protein